MTRPHIATGNVPGHDGPVLLVEMPGGWCGFYTNAGGAGPRWYPGAQVTNVRPLAAVDPGDWQATIDALFRAADCRAISGDDGNILHNLGDQLAAQQPAALPDEPGAGAVVDVILPSGLTERWWHDHSNPFKWRPLGPPVAEGIPWAGLHARGTVTVRLAGL